MKTSAGGIGLPDERWPTHTSLTAVRAKIQSGNIGGRAHQPFSPRWLLFCEGQPSLLAAHRPIPGTRVSRSESGSCQIAPWLPSLHRPSTASAGVVRHIVCKGIEKERAAENS